MMQELKPSRTAASWASAGRLLPQGNVVAAHTIHHWRHHSIVHLHLGNMRCENSIKIKLVRGFFCLYQVTNCLSHTCLKQLPYLDFYLPVAALGGSNVATFFTLHVIQRADARDNLHRIAILGK